MNDLRELRQKIDSIDTTLVDVLNQRARISLDVGAGAAKRSITSEDESVNVQEVQVYNPAREREILEKLSLINTGPLNDNSLNAIFREIFSASKKLQTNVSIAYLGSPGTFSHQAAYSFFGDDVEYVPQKQIDDVFGAVEKGVVTYGIVPFENSTFGAVVETLDCFINSMAKVRAETYLMVHQCLLSNNKLDKITKVYGHPQGLGQTRNWLSAHVPNALRIAVKSSSEAAEKAAVEPGAAAISSEITAKLYGLNIVEANIEDREDNSTRFLIIGTVSDSITTDDHTLIRFTVNHRQPGALCDGLKVFKDYGLNLFKIESRPSGQQPGRFVFFVECSGHFESEEIKNALKDLDKFCLDIVVLGSFPNQRTERYDGVNREL